VAGLLKWLAVATGATCAAIGLYHLTLGISSVPGEGRATTLAGVTVDSRERFYNAIFFGYGTAWIWVARQSPIPAKFVRWLAGLLFLGGIGRLLSLIQHGPPHWFQIPLIVIELAVPPLYVWLAPADERSAAEGQGPR
jgi:hypothetical protein